VKRGKLVILGIGIAVITSLWGLEWGSRLLLASHLGVKKIEVKGCQRMDRQQILEAASITYQTPILKLDLKKIAQRVESIPWVRSCQVRRVLPDKLSLRIVERKPVALIYLNGLYYLDEDGTPFTEPSPGEKLDYPVLTGWVEQRWQNGEGKRLIQEALRFLAQVQKYPHLSHQGISEIHLGELGELIVFTTRGTMINLGRGDVGIKASRLEEVWRRTVARHLPVKYILCESPDRIVVGLGERG